MGYCLPSMVSCMVCSSFRLVWMEFLNEIQNVIINLIVYLFKWSHNSVVCTVPNNENRNKFPFVIMSDFYIFFFLFLLWFLQPFRFFISSCGILCNLNENLFKFKKILGNNSSILYLLKVGKAMEKRLVFGSSIPWNNEVNAISNSNL